MRPISTTAQRTCGRTSPPGPRVCTALATTLRTERTARITAFAASFGAGDDLGQFDYFLPRLLDAGAEALFVNHSGGFVLTARVLLRSAAWRVGGGLGQGMASRFTGQLVCCSCLGVLIRSVNQVRTVGPTTHARGPRPGPWTRTRGPTCYPCTSTTANTGSHTPLQVTREPDDRACPYSYLTVAQRHRKAPRSAVQPTAGDRAVVLLGWPCIAQQKQPQGLSSGQVEMSEFERRLACQKARCSRAEQWVSYSCTGFQPFGVAPRGTSQTCRPGGSPGRSYGVILWLRRGVAPCEVRAAMAAR